VIVDMHSFGGAFAAEASPSVFPVQLKPPPQVTMSANGLTAVSGTVPRWVTRRSIEPAAIEPAAIDPAAIEPAAVGGRIASALDAAASVPLGTPPTSAVWVVIGFLQYLVTGVLLFSALWIAVIAFGRVDVASAVIPVLGPVPTPLLLLAGALAAGYILARMLGAHARWLGRRWSARMRRAVTAELQPRLELAVLGPLDAIAAARTALARAHAVTRGD
jgi:hypothetical protein